jgi:hypothetical protein
MQILNHQDQLGAIQDKMGLIMTVRIGTRMNCRQSYYIQTYRTKIC